MKKVFLVVLMMLAIGLGLYFYASSKAPEVHEQKVERPDSNTLASIDGFKLIDQEFDRTKMTITAKRAALTTRRFHQFYRLAIGNVVEMDAPSFVINDEKGGNISITGKSAIVDPVKKEVVFTGACVVKSPDKSELSSEDIVWKYARGYVQVKGGYKLKKDGREVRGERLIADLRLSRIDGRFF